MKRPQVTLPVVAHIFWTGLIDCSNASRSDTFMTKRSVHVSQAPSLAAVSSRAVAVQSPPGLEKVNDPRHYDGVECHNLQGAATPGPQKWMLRDRPDMSSKVCYSFCIKHKTIYFATRAGTDCVCFDRYETDNTENATCDMACKGDSAEMCGGEKSWSLHIMSAWVGKWVEKPCGPCPSVDHALYSRAEGSSAVPSTCEVACTTGYGVSVNNLLCDTTRGVWVGTALCQEILCTTVPRIPNSSHVCPKASVAKNDGACDVTCLPGFMLHTNTLKCTPDGSSKEVKGILTGEAVCKAQACELSTVYPNTIAAQVTAEFGEKVPSTCAPGFSLDGTKNGSISFTSTCQQDGTMSLTDAMCKPKMCGQVMPVIANARPQPGIEGSLSSPGIFYPNSTTYECREGYQLADSRSGEKRFAVSCQVTGDWTEFPSCDKVPCGPPPIVENAVLVDSSASSKTALFEDKVLYKCQPGYSLDKAAPKENQFQLTCNADTLFSAQPMCVKVSCGDPLGMVGGAQMRKYIEEAFFGDKLEYECPNGFTPTGHASDPATVSGECMEDGKIVLSDPAKSTCKKVSCDMNGLSVANIEWDASVVEMIKKGVKAFDKLPYTCKEYYSTDGTHSPGSKKSSIRCGADGKFSETEVKCKNINDCVGHTCGPFGTCVDELGNYSCACVMNKTQKIDKVTGELVCGDPWECGPQECGAGTCVDLINEYTCDCPIGHPLLTYNDGKDKACSDEPVACGLAPQIANTEPISKKMVFGDNVTYICKTGYITSDGSTASDGRPGFVVACGAHPDDVELGKLFGLNSCVPVKCGSPPRAENPMITYAIDKEFSYLDVVTYTCPVGQTVSDPKGLPVSKGGSKTFNRSCLDTGKFSPESGECDLVTCAVSVPPRMVAEPIPRSIRFGKSNFTCKKGYTLDPSNPTQGDVIELQCQEDGTITGLQHCEPIMCNAPFISEDGGAQLMKFDPQFHLHQVTALESSILGSLDAPMHSRVAPLYVPLMEGKVATYTRHEVGYYFIGDGGQEIHEFSAQCGPTGEMVGIKPSHKISCGEPPFVANGEHKNARSSTMSFKDVVTVQCSPEYEMHPTIYEANKKPANKKEFNLVCQGNTQIAGLHGVPPDSACVLAVCNKPEQKCSDGGGVCQPGAGLEGRPYICKCPKDYEYKIDEGDAVCAEIPKLTECPTGACGIHGKCLLANYTYSCDCNNGYELKVVNATGLQVCKKKSCPALEIVSNSTMTEPANLKYADEMTVSCKPGFSVDGSSTDFKVACRADGTLTPLFVCRLVECGLAPEVHFSKSISVVSVEVTGQKLFLQRQPSGPPVPPVMPRLPGMPPMPPGMSNLPGRKTQASPAVMPKTSGMPGTSKIPGTKTQPTQPTRVFVAGETAAYSCIDGYSLDGKPSGEGQLLVQCQLDGSFGPVTHCEPISCGIPPGISNGQQGQPVQVAFPNEVAYVCNPGYSFDAAKLSDTYKKLKCNSNGTFTSLDGVQVYSNDVSLECHKVSCGKPPEFSGSHRPDVTKYFDETVTYTCDAGHSINGAPQGDTKADSKCQVDGTYSLKRFSCKPIKVSIAGYIRDATSGSPIPDTQVVVMNAGEEILGEVASAFDGKFDLQGVPLGSVALKAVKNGYTAVSKDLQLEGSVEEGTVADLYMSPDLTSGELRFVLTWSDKPPDLDSHLHWGPGGRRCHVYYNQPAVACGSYDGVSASLDIDDYNGYGPETITVKNLEKCRAPNLGPDTCKFFYRVINFSGGGQGNTRWEKFSGATVKVYGGKGLLAEFDISKHGIIDRSRDMENWFVFGMEISQSGNTTIFKCEDAGCSGDYDLSWNGYVWEWR